MEHGFNLYLSGGVGENSFSSDMVSYVLDRNAGKPVNVLINSLGGSASEALTIASLFKLHGAVEVHYIGNNASAATIVSMGAKKVTMDSAAMYLVHKTSMALIDFDFYNADMIEQRIQELKDYQEDLSKFDDVIVSMYAGRCKKDKQALMELMKRGGWLTAKEALDWGFVDEITDDPRDKQEQINAKTVKKMVAAGMPPIPGMEPGFIEKLKNFINEIKLVKMGVKEEKDGQETVDETTVKEPQQGEEVAELRRQIEVMQKNNDEMVAEIQRLKGIVDERPADVTTSVVATATKPKVESSKNEGIEKFLEVKKEAEEMFNYLK